MSAITAEIDRSERKLDIKYRDEDRIRRKEV